jgi:hypothetical protein
LFFICLPAALAMLLEPDVQISYIVLVHCICIWLLGYLEDFP